MIVYVEAVIFDNFCLDSLLGCLTLSLAGIKRKGVQVVLSAAIASVIALFSPFVPEEYAMLLKVGTLLLSTAIISAPCSLRRWIVNTFLYAILSFGVCGLLTFVLGSDERGLVGCSFGGAVGLISVVSLFTLYAVRQIHGLIREKKRENKHAVAELINRENSVRLNVLFDTGNLLTDEKGGSVVVTDRKRIEALGTLLPLGEMRVKTASGSAMLPLVKIPEIKIYSRDGENILTNVTAALSDLPDEYALILPCE